MDREHVYNSGRIHRTGAAAAPARTRRPEPEPKQAKPKKKRRKGLIVLMVLLIIVGLGAAGLGALYVYVDGVFDPGEFGFIKPENYTPKEFQKDSINILIVGIDYEEGRSYEDGLGLTDMILVANFLPKEKKLNLLQIPRDSYVGEIAGSDGKINSLMRTGPNTSDPINNLVDVIVDQYQIPIDRYISLDMDGMKAIVDTFNGIRVYVPKEMNNAGSYLPAGWQWLNGDQVEFFVRNRKGAGFERSDIDRLENQRHFYSALFRRFLNLTVTDMMNLLPVFEYYCNTDIGMKDLYDLAFSAMSLEAEGVVFCRVPGATSSDGWQADPLGYERSFFIVDVYGRDDEENPGVAWLLNTYFRTYGEQKTAEQLNFPQVTIPGDVTLYPPDVRDMGSVWNDEGGDDVNVEPTGE